MTINKIIKFEQNKPRKQIIFKNIVVYILGLFLAINVSMYITTVVKSTAFSPHKRAKLILSSSMYLTGFYILPIGHILGPKTPVLKPLRNLRDKLYYAGINFLPKDDAEREMWWYSTKYLEFELYDEEIGAYLRGKITAEQLNLKYLLSFTDEMYYHLERMAIIKKLDDSMFQELRFKIFAGQVAFDYTNKRAFLLAKYDKNLLKGNEIKRYENILNWYFNLRDYCRIYEKKGFDFVFNDKHKVDCEPRLLYFTTGIILNDKILKNENICHSNTLKLFLDSRSLLSQIGKFRSKESYVNELLDDGLSYELGFYPIVKYSQNKCGIKPY